MLAVSEWEQGNNNPYENTHNIVLGSTNLYLIATFVLWPEHTISLFRVSFIFII
jgi:hypothetical protein